MAISARSPSRPRPACRRVRPPPAGTAPGLSWRSGRHRCKRRRPSRSGPRPTACSGGRRASPAAKEIETDQVGLESRSPAQPHHPRSHSLRRDERSTTAVGRADTEARAGEPFTAGAHPPPNPASVETGRAPAPMRKRPTARAVARGLRGRRSGLGTRGILIFHPSPREPSRNTLTCSNVLGLRTPSRAP
jgi:hypothetical protein